MKKGFALLETMIVITFLCVSLLMLYKTFSNMIINSKKNILYDDVSNIYKAYYMKEYLKINGLNELLEDKEIKKIECTDFKTGSCETLKEALAIENIYLVKYNLKEYQEEEYKSSFNNYISTLSNKEDYKYRLILEFTNDDNYSYANIGLNGEEND